MASTVDRLYERVSAAIFKAEKIPNQRSKEAKAAYAEVSCIEEQIADLAKPFCTEGMVARRGAVRAALKSGDKERAAKLVKRFGTDFFKADPFLKELQVMVRKA